MLAEITSFVAADAAIPSGSFADADAETAADQPVDSEPGNAQAFIDAFVNDEPAVDELAAIELPVPVRVAVEEPTLDDETIERYRHVKVGDWLDLVNDDGRITAARISWTSPISGRHMLSNRRGQRIMVASVDELALMDAEGQVSIRSNDAAFDVALNVLADRLARTAGTLTTT